MPTVTIQSPAAGAALGGIVTVSGSASDNVSVSKVELRVDANPYQLASGTTFWTFSLNTSAYASGSHTLTARATDSSGNQATTSRTVTFGSRRRHPGSHGHDHQPGRGRHRHPCDHRLRHGLRQRLALESGAAGGRQPLPAGERDDVLDLHPRTSAYAGGSHTLTARATDSSGNQAWAGRTVTFTSVPNAKVYWGAFMEAEDTYSYHYGGTWGNGPWDASTVSRFESNAGKKVSIMHWGAAPPWEHDFNNWRSGFDLVQNAGALSLVGMMTGTVPLRDIANGLYDASVRTWFQQAAAYGRPFFLLLNPEMNGTWQWYSPGINGNTAADFVAAWRRFHDLAQQEGATNITWVWCPNVDPTNMYTPYSALYPGDAYVDWTGFNGFNRDGKSSFSWLFGSSYSTLLQIAPTKPILISETSSEETLGNKVGWITDTFSSQLPLYFPRIKAVVWFNWRMWQNPRWWNWEIESTPSAQQAFATAISSPYYLAGGGLGNLPLLTKITPP